MNQLEAIMQQTTMIDQKLTEVLEILGASQPTSLPLVHTHAAAGIFWVNYVAGEGVILDHPHPFQMERYNHVG